MAWNFKGVSKIPLWLPILLLGAEILQPKS
jgi:hypothetical protein